MTLTSEAAVTRIAHGVIAQTLPKAEWSHAAHFALTLWICRHRPDLAAGDAMRALISGYNAATGTANTDTSGYHHTITMASIRAAAAHLARYPDSVSLPDLLSALLALDYGRSDWLLTYWSRAALFSVAARRDWRPPDLLPLPF